MARSKQSNGGRRGGGNRRRGHSSSASSAYMDTFDSETTGEQALEKPRRYQTPYTAFVKSSWAEHRTANPEVKFDKEAFKAFTASIVAKWKGMSEEEKAPFVETSTEERARYQELMVAYKAQQLALKKNTPKRPLGSYMLFAADEREKVREELGGPAAKVVDIAKELGRRWVALETGRKEEYKAKAAQARQEYYVERDEAAAVGSSDDEQEEEEEEKELFSFSEDDEVEVQGKKKVSHSDGSGSYSYSSGESSEYSEDDEDYWCRPPHHLTTTSTYSPHCH